MSEPFPAGTRFLVGIVLEARTFQEAREEAARIVGDAAQVSHVFGRISPGSNASSAPQIIDPRGALEDPVL